eukprot:6760618-Prorocentrum_lima.AAC.1
MQLTRHKVRLISAHAPTEAYSTQAYSDLLHTLSSLLLRGNTVIGLDGNARLSSSQSALIGPHGEEAETHTSPHGLLLCSFLEQHDLIPVNTFSTFGHR